MAFVPRSFETILTDMIAHVRANTTLTDFNVGSVIRTLLEASALEDDEQYFQMVQLLDAFSYQTALGTELDERAADFNVTRLSAAQSSGYIKVRNDNLESDYLLFNVSSGGTSLTLSDADEFPTSGFPYTVRVGEGTAQVEDVSVTANVSNVLTCGALASSHNANERVSLVTGNSDLDISSGVQVQVPATGSSVPIIFQTVALGTVLAGDYESGLIPITSSENGSANNVGAGTITQFSGSSPFAGAGVTNPSSTGGGRDRETDIELRDRLRERLNELSRGTPSAVESAVKGLEDPDTGQRVVSSQLLENFETNEHTLFVDDGTGFTPSSVQLARTTLVNPVTGGVTTTLDVSSSADFPVSGYILVDPGDSTNVELLEYTSKSNVSNQLILSGAAANSHAVSDEVVLVDVMPLAEEGQNYFQLTNYPIQDVSSEIYHNESGAYTLQTIGTDYYLNRSNGQLQFFDEGLAAGTQVLASYTYYTGLMQLAQKVLNGDKDDPVNYPGYTAAGIIVHVASPVIRQVSISMSISVSVGFDEDDVRSDVLQIVENYIDGLRIGENVILAKIIELAMRQSGVSDAKIISPTSNIVILEEELPKSFGSSGNSLVTVF